MKMSMGAWRWCGLATALVLLWGCEGVLEQRDDASPGEEMTSGSGADLGAGITEMGEGEGGEQEEMTPPYVPPTPQWDTSDCSIPQPGMSQMRRLTRDEYLNLVDDFFGEQAEQVNSKGLRRDLDPPSQEEVMGFDNNVFVQQSTPRNTLEYLQQAELVARYAKQYAYAQMMPCLNLKDEQARVLEEQAAAPSCLEGFIRAQGATLWRRPLGEEEVARLKQMYAQVHATVGDSAMIDPPAGPPGQAAQAFQAVIVRMMMSPQFLYRVELGQADTPSGEAIPLTDHEIAARLAFLMLRRGPDAALLAAAEKGELHTEAQVRQQVDRLWQSPAGQAGMRSFLAQWLELEQIESISTKKDVVSGKKIDPYEVPIKTFRSQVRQETDRFITAWGDGTLAPTLGELLTSPWSEVNVTLAKFYGVEGFTGEGFQPVTLDPTQRSGLLTRLGWSSVMSFTHDVSSTQRGVFLARRLLCAPPSDPPPDAALVLPSPNAQNSQRQRLEELTSVQPCAACHAGFDPLGFALDAYDYTGRWRDTYRDYNTEGPAHAIDTRATVRLDGAEVQVSGPVELMARLAESEQVAQCAVSHMFAFAYGREAEVDWQEKSGEDYCTMASLRERFSSSDRDFRELLTAIVLADQFRYVQPRATEGE